MALCFTQFGPYELREGSWDTEREAYGKKVVRTIAEYCPGFEDSVEEMEVLAPPDMEERWRVVYGELERYYTRNGMGPAVFLKR